MKRTLLCLDWSFRFELSHTRRHRLTPRRRPSPIDSNDVLNAASRFEMLIKATADYDVPTADADLWPRRQRTSSPRQIRFRTRIAQHRVCDLARKKNSVNR